MPATKCRICGKTLKDDDSRFGPDCKARYNEALLIIETDEIEVGQLFLTGDATVMKWLSKMSVALIAALKSKGAQRMKHITFAKDAIKYAREAAEIEPFELLEAA